MSEVVVSESAGLDHSPSISLGTEKRGEDGVVSGAKTERWKVQLGHPS